MTMPDQGGQQDGAYNPQPMRIRSTGQPPKAKRKRTTPLWVTISVGVAAFGLGAGAGGGKTDTTTNAGSPAPAVTTVYVTAAAPAPVAVTTTAAAVPAASKPAAAPATSKAAPAPAATKAPAPAPKPTTTKPPAPATKVVLHVSGNGIKTTQNFTVGPEWSLSYTYNCSSFGMSGNFAVIENNGNGSVLANTIGDKGADTTYQHSDGGTHSLEVNSECDWTMTVTDGG
jgi:hypothetical protein